MPTDPWSTQHTFVEHLRAAAAAMHGAGISVYLAEYMDGSHWSDNVIEGDGAAHSANITAWTMRENPDGTYSMSVGVRGGVEGLYEREPGWGGHLTLRTDAAERFGRYNLAEALRQAEMRVKKVDISAFDIGFGTRDVHYLVTYAPTRP